MEAASNALFDELILLFDNDYRHYCERIDTDCEIKCADIFQSEEDRLGGMPMSGIMWDRVEEQMNRERAKAAQKKDRLWEHLLGHAQKSFEWWVLAVPGGMSRLEMSMAIARS